ncbi:MAG: barstar family protein [Clostridia bacterium]|nr:barstar family protein [Clostridia bacterium]
MKTVFLDGNRIETAEMMHAEFKAALDFPEWYGNNLDALHDLLTESTEPIGVILVNTDKLSEALGRRWTALLRLLVDLKRSRERFYVLMEPFGEE